MIDKDYELQIDLNQKIIIVEKMPFNAFENRTSFPADSLAIRMIKEQDATLTEEEDSFVISTTWPDYICAYHFNKSSCHLTKVVYDFEADHDYKQMVAVYQNIKIDNKEFSYYSSHKDFIAISEHRIDGLNDFSSYTIIDNRQ